MAGLEEAAPGPPEASTAWMRPHPLTRGGSRHHTQVGSATGVLSQLSTRTGPEATQPLPGDETEREVCRRQQWGGTRALGGGGRGEHRPPADAEVTSLSPRALVHSQAAVFVCCFEIKTTTGCHGARAAEAGWANGKEKALSLEEGGGPAVHTHLAPARAMEQPVLVGLLALGSFD